jgi:hypothetical protein
MHKLKDAIGDDNNMKEEYERVKFALNVTKGKVKSSKAQRSKFQKTSAKLTLLEVIKVIRSLNMLELNGMSKTQSFKGLKNVWNMPKVLLQNQKNLLLRRKNALSCYHNTIPLI